MTYHHNTFSLWKAIIMVINDYISGRRSAVEAINTKSNKKKSFTNYNPSFCVCIYMYIIIFILINCSD